MSDGRRERQLGNITPNLQRYEATLPDDALAAVTEQVCPFCGEGPFVVVASHVYRMHGITARDLRNMLGLYASKSICDPAHSAYCRDRLTDPDKQLVLRDAWMVADRSRKADRDAAVINAVKAGQPLTAIARDAGIKSLGVIKEIVRRHGEDDADLRPVAGRRKRGERPDWLVKGTATANERSKAKAAERLAPIAARWEAGESIRSLALERGIATGELARQLRAAGHPVPDLRAEANRQRG